MLSKLFRFIANQKCPRCGSTNIDKGGRGGIWVCYDCGHEW